MTKHAHSSIQIIPPGPLVDQIIAWGQKSVPDPQTDIHLSVLYGLHYEETNSIKRLKIKPFEVQLGKISTFITKKLNVVKINAHGQELHQLHQKLTKLAHTNYYSTFDPHITIAYTENHYPDCNDFIGTKFLVNTLYLSSKTGVKTLIDL